MTGNPRIHFLLKSYPYLVVSIPKLICVRNVWYGIGTIFHIRKFNYRIVDWISLSNIIRIACTL